MLRNLNHHHHHVAASAGPTTTTTLSVVTPQSYAISPPPSTVQPSSSMTPTATAGGFSIYSRNISFEQGYRSNYTYQNASFVAADISQCLSGGASPTYGGSSAASTATAVSEAEQLMAGLARQGFYVTKSVKGAQLKPKPKTPPTTVALNNNTQQMNYNSCAVVANGNIVRQQPQQQQQQQASSATVAVSKGVVDILHNYSKQRCEEETDRLRMRKAAAMRHSKGYVDDDDEEEDDEEDDDDDVDDDEERDEGEEELDVVDHADDEDEHVDVTSGCDDDVADVPIVMVAPKPTRIVHRPVRETVIVPPPAAVAQPSPPSPQPEDKPAPEHHARRPMNAFLIFCKRHRAIVREKYPNLENRAITKILGDWWANIDGPEKESFNRLASEYKDAFFSANPTFQWYKLPAPPLRTLNSRPSCISPAAFLSESAPCTRAAPSPTSSSSSHVGMFKLADEAHMGGLNDLMGGQQETMSPEKAAASRARSEADKRNSDLQAALGDATTFFAKTMSTNRTEPFRHYRVVKRKSDPGAMNGSAASSPPAKRSVSESSIVTSPVDFERFVQANFKQHDAATSSTNETLSSEDDSGPPPVIQSPAATNNHTNSTGPYTKSTRACKGKRYLEFINTVRVATAAPKKSHQQQQQQQLSKAAAAIATSAVSTATSARTASEQQFDHMYAASRSPQNRDDTGRISSTAAAAADAKALIDTNDFDLNGKIMALLALSLDDYLSRKRDTKKKKKITVKKPSAAVTVNRRPKSSSSSQAAQKAQQQQQQQLLLQKQQQQLHEQQHQIACLMRAQTALERREQIQSAAVGSQKRKARKESITRRDIVGSGPQQEQPLVVVVPPSQQQPVSPQPEVASPDLFILAQVAAIITSK